MVEMKRTLLSVVVALACTACGNGGGSSTQAVAPSASSGKAIDGYLSAAQVLCDANSDGVAQSGETTVTTDSTGNFTFLSGCAFPIVTTGGTNIDTGLSFQGRLQAPAGSTVVTPLTSLMVSSGLTASQVATALGLPAGTDVSKTDPVGNLVLQTKTLAVQQIIQQVANTIASLGGNTTPLALQAIYSQVAKAVVTTLVSNPSTPLVDASGAVKPTLVTAMVAQSVTNVKTNTDPTLAALRGTSGTLGTFSSSSIAALISGSITIQAQALSTATDTAALTAVATTLQASPIIAQAATQLAVLLTTTAAQNVNLGQVGNSLQVLSNPISSSVDKHSAVSAVSSLAATQAANAGVAAPTVTASTWAQPTNNISVKNDTIILNGTPLTLAAFESSAGVSFARRAVSIDSIGLAVNVNGTPIPMNADGVMTSTVSLGVELTDTGSGGRVLQLMLDQVNLTVSNGSLNVTVPAGAKLYVYGKTSNGTTGNLIVTNITADQFLSTATNHLVFNAGKVLTRILSDVNAQPTGSMQALFNSLSTITGTFNLKMVASNLSLASTNATSVAGLSVAVTNSGQPAVNGLGVSGIITVTP